MPHSQPRLAVTVGDCAGVGPELVLRALGSSEGSADCRLFVYGNRRILERVARAAGVPFPDDIAVLPPDAHARVPEHGHILFDFPCDADVLACGKVQAECGALAHRWICAAVRDIQAGHADALVTAPINKEALHLAGVPFPGHTEMLSDLTATPNPCMAFYSAGLIVSLATIHEALSDVPHLLNVRSLLRTVRLTHDACRGFGIAAPRVGVLALNPHAGEHGLFGKEETEILRPAIDLARADGMSVSDPLVPDAAFTWLLRTPQQSPYDAYVAMYHDQGLIPFKMVAFDTGVNVTLGLPIIRTSPDHGTAFDIAWQGKASPASLFSAIALAARMVRETRGGSRA